MGLFKGKDVPKTPEDIQARYAQMCARLGDVDFQIDRLEQSRCDLMAEVRKTKAEFDKVVSAKKPVEATHEAKSI